MPDFEMNDLGQPIGLPVPNWTAAHRPDRRIMQGNYCRLEPLDAALHAEDLFRAMSLDEEGRGWTYLHEGPFREFDNYRNWLAGIQERDDPLFFAIADLATGKAVGLASYMRIAPRDGVIEVGSIHFSPLLQRKPAATESMYLMMRHVFEDLGYRRYEWKCNALNEPSRRAAERLGFTFEGVFRQALVVKGRNRDTAWYSILDSEWPTRQAALEAWLAPENFDGEGKQRKRLQHFHG